jgi:hypothetical protein
LACGAERVCEIFGGAVGGSRSAAGVTEEGRKRFFFEKKKQKTFISLLPMQDVKVFWFFFSKKNAYLLSPN